MNGRPRRGGPRRQLPWRLSERAVGRRQRAVEPNCASGIRSPAERICQPAQPNSLRGSGFPPPSSHAMGSSSGRSGLPQTIDFNPAKRWEAAANSVFTSSSREAAVRSVARAAWMRSQPFSMRSCCLSVASARSRLLVNGFAFFRVGGPPVVALRFLGGVGPTRATLAEHRSFAFQYAVACAIVGWSSGFSRHWPPKGGTPTAKNHTNEVLGRPSMG
jgi:hypothetical protein